MLKFLLKIHLQSVYNYKFELIFHTLFAIMLGFVFYTYPSMVTAIFTSLLYLWQRFLTYQLSKYKDIR